VAFSICIFTFVRCNFCKGEPTFIIALAKMNQHYISWLYTVFLVSPFEQSKVRQDEKMRLLCLKQ
jgi:hypothetical protein